MGDNLFEGLPPPSHQQQQKEKKRRRKKTSKDQNFLSLKTGGSNNNNEAPSNPVFKSSLKRPKRTESNPEAAAPEKRLRFKMTTDASGTQVIESVQNIASHIKNPTKSAKALKLAIQLIQAKSVKAGTSDHFFAILEAAMLSTTSSSDPSVQGNYHLLFSAAQDAAECLNKKQKNQLTVWTFRAVMANDLLTDDNFVDAVSSLPIATKDDDIDEAATLKDETEIGNDDDNKKQAMVDPAEGNNKADPFGLDSVIPRSGKKDDETKGKKDVSSKSRKEDDKESKRFLKSQREALTTCLDIAARRYKTPCCQKATDILVKHAFDNESRFTS